MKPGTIACVVWLAGLLWAPGPASAQTQTLPAVIPIFPLQDVVLFPSVSRPLMIFEPRYRTMVLDALKGDRIIGMVLLRPGYEADYQGRPPIFAVGCAGRIAEFELLPDGRYMIELRGFTKFRVRSEDQSRPYRLARVDALPDVPGAGDTADISMLRLRLEALLATSIPPNSDLLSLPDEEFVNGLAQNMPLEPGLRQQLLELMGPVARAQALIEWLERQ